MWEPFRLSIEQWAPNCRIVYDQFRIQQHARQAIDAVQRAGRVCPQGKCQTPAPWRSARALDWFRPDVRRTEVSAIDGYSASQTNRHLGGLNETIKAISQLGGQESESRTNKNPGILGLGLKTIRTRLESVAVHFLRTDVYHKLRCNAPARVQHLGSGKGRFECILSFLGSRRLFRIALLQSVFWRSGTRLPTMNVPSLPLVMPRATTCQACH